VDGSDSLLWVGYSYWALGYLLTLKGAEKLLAGEPLGRLVPVDEYLPIMYDRHPELGWAEAFPTRNLKVRVKFGLLLSKI
jgi:collagen beta-1,O-galactosyltransferase